MQVGIIGLGSMGQRHARGLSLLGADVRALRTRRGVVASLPDDLRFVRECDERDFFADYLDGVIIANPTSLHGTTLRSVLERTDAKVMVEKPLAAFVADIAGVSERDRERVRVAFCLRFHPVVDRVHQLVCEGAVGPVIAGSIRFGSFMPHWQPGIDYRRSYAARRDLGGGALRTLSHELDLVQHWLGPIAEVSGIVRPASMLEADVDEVAQVVCRTQRGASVAVELNYVSPIYDRRGHLVGTQGRVDYSLAPPSITLSHVDDPPAVLFEAPESPDVYIPQLRDFIGWLEGEESTACTFSQGMHIVAVIEAAERCTPQPVQTL